MRSVKRGSAILVACVLLLVPLLGCSLSRDQNRSKTLLVVLAHPDDETFIGPLLSHYARQGVRISVAIATDGARGGRSSDTPSLRAEEARCSCAALGIESPRLLGFKDDELGMPNDPPNGYLVELVRVVRALIDEVRPDVIVTWGPEGGYGHPDHRLVGAVVTEVVQTGTKNGPSRLLYPAFPVDRMHRAAQDPHWAVTDPRFLTVRVPYDATDLAAAQRAFACHKTQFSARQAAGLVRRLDEALGGRVYLRPWFGAQTADDVFALNIP